MTRELTLRDYLAVLWSGRLLILALVVIAAVVGLATTFARPTTYTATATVKMGQPTTVSGVPVQTALTVPSSATQVLMGDEYVDAVAKKAGTTPGEVRRSVTLSAPRVTGASSGNQPTVITITSQNGARQRAIDIANAFADEAFGAVDGPFRGIIDQYTAQKDQNAQQVTMLTAEIRDLRAKLVQAAGTDRASTLQFALLSAMDQLRAAQLNATTAEINLIKAQNNEAPGITSRAVDASSSASAPKRLQTVVFAALVGLILGILAVFVWKGSPAGRAREA